MQAWCSLTISAELWVQRRDHIPSTSAHPLAPLPPASRPLLAHYTGSQLEMERAKALSHEATAEELKQRIATLQELKLKEQLEHSQAIDKMIAQLQDAQAKVAEASGIRKKAEAKYITAREWAC